MPIQPTSPNRAGAVSKLTDGTVDAVVVRAAEAFGAGYRLTVRLPAGLSVGGSAGRYFLARCGAATLEERLSNWQMYLRRPLFAGDVRVGGAEGEEWELYLPDVTTPGNRWLLERLHGALLNLVGPLGNGFALDDHARNLLLVGRDERCGPLLPLIDAMLDRGGRVTLLLVETVPAQLRQDLLPRLPIAVEVHIADGDGWPAHVAELAQWADQICAALPHHELSTLALTIRRARLRFDPGFALVLPEADLACGYGACLACVVPTAGGGLTRACVNGPVFDLLRLTQA